MLGEAYVRSGLLMTAAADNDDGDKETVAY